jgi:hypothetical protein
LGLCLAASFIIGFVVEPNAIVEPDSKLQELALLKKALAGMQMDIQQLRVCLAAQQR